VRRRLDTARLAELVNRSRLSQNHWAIKLGLSRGHWSDLLNGRHPYPSSRTRQRIAEVFGVDEDELFVAESGSTGDHDFRLAMFTRFEIIGELGAGGMGTVYHAFDRHLARDVALKMVSAEAASGVGSDQLLQEIRHVARLQHPNILPLFEAGEEAGRPWYTMPLVQAGSLGQLLRNRTRLSLSETVPLLRAVARGLAHAHERQVLHCDVKPENILIQDGHPYVMDFGIARRIHSESNEWRGVRRGLDYSAGTPAYVSPEQAAGDRDLDHRSDVYSLACVVFEMLAGRAPFTGSTTREVVSLRFRIAAPDIRAFAPELPRAAVEVLQRAMSIDPARRPPTADAFADELAASSTGVSVAVQSLAVGTTRTLARARAGLGLQGPPSLSLPMTGFVNDLRCAARSLRRQWRFSLGVVLSLGAGLGLGLPAFGLADHLFLRPPPGVRDADRVMQLVQRAPDQRGGFYYNNGLTGLDYTEITRRSTSFEGVAGWIVLPMSAGRGPEARRLSTLAASASYFPVLGLTPFLGRFYTPDEDVQGVKAGPAVVTHRYWRIALGGDSAALGRRLDIGTVAYTIVGVAPPGFEGLDFSRVDVIVPLRVLTPDFQGTAPELWTTDQSSWLRMTARLKPGVSVAVATDEANRIYTTSGPRVRDKELKGGLVWDPLQPGKSSLPSVRTRVAVWIAGAAALLLVLVLANLLNLFLARTASTRRQVALRLAIGGGRKHLLRLHLLEAALLGVIATGLAIAIAAPATSVIRSNLFTGVTWSRATIDLRLTLFAFALTVLIGGLVALASANTAARVDPAALLRATGSDRASIGRTGAAIRQTLVVIQAAIFVVIVTGALAFTASVNRVMAIDMGFEFDEVIVASVPLRSVGYSQEDARRFYNEAHQRLSSLPGLESVSLGYTEAWQNNRTEDLRIPGYDHSSQPFVLFDAVTPDYARTMQLRVREGRWIAESDAATAPAVVVVSDAFVKTFFPNGGAMGTCIGIGDESNACRTIVGIVADPRVTGSLDGPAVPLYYLPMAQATNYTFTPRLFVRASGRVEGAMNMVRRELQRSAPDLPAVTVRRLSEGFAPYVSTFRLGRLLFGVFGALAGFVAAVGLYSVLSYLATERRREYAIRVALGAGASRVAEPILRHSLGSAAAGLASGLGIVVIFADSVEAMLFRSSVVEPAVLGAAAALGVAIGLVAAVGPVLTVLRTDAMGVLREP
jgi:putative ABC transport system permease protein